MSPKLDSRTFGDLVATAQDLATQYVPNWAGAVDDTDPGNTAVSLFSRLMEVLIERENRIPDKHFLKLLDIVGVRQSPGQSASVPVSFLLGNKQPQGALVNSGTQVATSQTADVTAQIYETETSFFLSKANITQVVSIEPGVDRFNELTVQALPPTPESFVDTSGAIAVLGTDPLANLELPHIMYVGSESLFAREEGGHVVIIISVTAGNASLFSPATLSWKYFNQDTELWEPLAVEVVSTSAGEIRIRLLNVPKVEPQLIQGIESSYVAAFLAPGHANDLDLPVITDVHGYVEPVANTPAVVPDFAFKNTLALDVSAPMKPFGDRPKYGDAFYLGSGVAFSSNIEQVLIQFTVLPHPDSELQLQFAGINADQSFITSVDWQYLNDADKWLPLASFAHQLVVTTGSPVTVGRISTPAISPAGPLLGGDAALIGNVGNLTELRFNLPEDIALKSVNGEESYWLRAMLKSTEPYGSDGLLIPGATTTDPTIFVGPLRFEPTIDSTELTYLYRTTPKRVTSLITQNGYQFEDHQTDIETSGAIFRPYYPAPDTVIAGIANLISPDPAVYIGLDKPLENASISIFVHLLEPASGVSTALESGEPLLVWEYLGSENLWQPLDVIDNTANLTTSGTIAFLAASDAVAASVFPSIPNDTVISPYWLRARLASGRYDFPPQLLGVYLNTVIAKNRETRAELLLGSGNGKAHQQLRLVRAPVLGGELWVRELERPSEIELDELRADIIAAVIADQSDFTIQTEELIESISDEETWVRWHEVQNFLSSNERSRHYTFNRVSGLLEFGDGERGVLTPIGKDNLKLLNAQFGGGEVANTATTPLAVKELITTLPFVDKVFNVIGADGGSNNWTTEEVFRFGPQIIKNRGRAVTTEDYEWMILEKFSQVAKVRCLATRAPGPSGELVFKPGAVTAIVVPKGSDNLPQPRNGLLSAVQSFLALKSLGAIVQDVYAIGPSYNVVSIDTQIVPTIREQASSVAKAVANALTAYFHPITGGPNQQGWDFGADVNQSNIIALISATPGVDHVVTAVFKDEPLAATHFIDENELSASGAHVVEVS